MEGYQRSSYGDGFADVYDQWYPGLDDADATVGAIVELAQLASPDRTPRLLELGVGTGRLAVPLSVRGLEVHGVDASTAMLAKLGDRDPDGRVAVTAGDMVDDLPTGSFDVVLVAYNTIFNLESAERQAAAFRAVAAHLTPGGVFVVEAFVPEDPPRLGTRIELRSMTATEVVLSVSSHDPARQRAEGHLVQLADGQPVRLRPWAIRYAPPSELDAMAAAAGLALRTRWEDFTRRPFTSDSSRHVSVYQSKRPPERRSAS